jgi:5'-nucleotidase
MTNGGGLRADIPAGPLTYGNLYTALPFGNRFVFLHMTGATLKEVLAHNLGSHTGILSLAGAEVVATCEKGALKLAVALTGRHPHAVIDTDNLTIVTSDFLASGGDGFKGGERLSDDAKQPIIRDAIAAWLKQRGGTLAPEDWFDDHHRRLRFPGKRPVVCPISP